eukprot:Nk52_evm31s156 gene=Nk52_evmTU31s156
MTGKGNVNGRKESLCAAKFKVAMILSQAVFLFLLVFPGAGVQGVTIKIGMGYGYLNPVSLAVEEFYKVIEFVRDMIHDHNDGVLDDLLVGHSIELVNYHVGCDMAGGVEGGYYFSQVNPVHAIVGMICSSSSIGALQITKIFKVPMCSFASTSPALSDNALYPYFLRTTPNDAAQGIVHVDILRRFGWKRVAIVSSKLDYSEGIYNTITQEAAKYNITFGVNIKLQGLVDAEKDASLLKELVKTLRESSTQVILLMLSNANFMEFVSVMHSEKYLTNEITMLGPDSVALENRRTDIAFGELLIGNIAVAPSGGGLTRLKGIIRERWGPATQYFDFDGNRTDINPVSYLAVDAFLAFAYGFQKVLDQGGNILDGELVYETAKGLTFNGASSENVNFNITNGESNAASYDIFQFYSPGKMRRVFTWAGGLLKEDQPLVWEKIPLDGSCPGDCSNTNGICNPKTATCTCLASFKGEKCDGVDPIPAQSTSGTFVYSSTSPCRSATYFEFLATQYTISFRIILRTGKAVSGVDSYDSLLFVEKGKTNTSQTLSQGFTWDISNMAPPPAENGDQIVAVTVSDTSRGVYSVVVVPTGQSCPAGFQIIVEEESTIIGDKCDDVNANGNRFYQNFSLAWKSSKYGVITELLFLVGFTCAVLYVVYRSIKKAKYASIRVVEIRKGIEFSVSNLIALGAVIIETFQIMSLCLQTDIEWNSIKIIERIVEVFGLEKQGIFFWAFWVAVAVAILWLFYALSLKVKLLYSLEQYSAIKLLLYPRAFYLPIIADIGFIPLTGYFLQAFSCQYMPDQAVALNLDSCSIECWSGVHFAYATFGLILSILYGTYVIRSSYYWQDLSRDLQVLYLPEYHVLNSFFKIVVVLMVSVFPDDVTSVLIAICILSIAFIVWIRNRMPCNVKWVNFSRQVGLGIIAELCLFGIILEEVKQKEIVFTSLFLTLSLLEILSGLWYIWKNYQPLFENKKSMEDDEQFGQGMLENIEISRRGSLHLSNTQINSAQNSVILGDDNEINSKLLKSMTTIREKERRMVLKLFHRNYGLFKICRTKCPADDDDARLDYWQGIAYLLASLAYFTEDGDPTLSILQRLREEIILKGGSSLERVPSFLKQKPRASGNSAIESFRLSLSEPAYNYRSSRGSRASRSNMDECTIKEIPREQEVTLCEKAERPHKSLEDT